MMQANGALSEVPEVAECKLVSLRVENQLLGIPVGHVRDVLKSARVTRVPLAPEEISGAMNLRGRIITVIDIRTRLHLPPMRPDASPMFIVVERGSEYFSLKVDTIGEVLTIPFGDIEKRPSNLSPVWREITSGVHRQPNELLMIVDIDTLLTPPHTREGA